MQPRGLYNVAHLHFDIYKFIPSFVLNTKAGMLSEYWKHFYQAVTCLPIAQGFYIYKPEGFVAFI